MTLYKWSQTAATNATADSTINWAEGQAPSTVNDSARAMMAAASKYRDDMAGCTSALATLITGGTSTAYTLTSNQVFASLATMAGRQITFMVHVTNGASPTLNVDGLGAKPIQTDTTTAVGTGVLTTARFYTATYFAGSVNAWILHNIFTAVADGSAAAPSFVLGTNTNTGIYRTSTGGWAVSHLGVARIAVGTGEGTASNSAFHINGVSAGNAWSAQIPTTSGVGLLATWYDGSNEPCGSITLDTTANTTAYNTTSGYDLKVRFGETGMNPGAIIDQLWVGDYERKSNPGISELGVVSEWTQDLFPQAVSTPGMVDYGKLSPLALWGVKDLRKRVEELEAKLAQLSSQ